MLHSYIMNWWLVISQLAALRLWHLHASECQSKHFGLSKSLCIQLGKFVLMLPVILQAQDHSVPQEPPSTPFGASCYKNTRIKPCCSITLLLGGKWEFWVQTLSSKRSNKYIVAEATPAAGVMKHQSLSFNPIEDTSKDQEEMSSSWAAQVPQYTRLYPPSIL